MTDYSTTTSVNTGALGAVLVIYWIVILAIAIFFIAGLWKTFAKAGKPGWAAIVPIYNIIVMLEVIGRPVWWILLYFIPFVNLIVYIIVSLDMAKAFGKSAAFGIFGLWLFSPIGYLMLGFGSAKYVGAPNKA
jgi:hypothetical protein